MDQTLTSMAVEILAPAAGVLATALATWLAAEAARYVRRKTKNEAAINAVDRLCHTAVSTVAELEQVFVPAMRARAADGKLSAGDRRSLKAAALHRIKTRLAPEIQKQAGLVIADLDKFLCAKIEQAVLELKRGPGEALPLIEPFPGELPE